LALATIADPQVAGMAGIVWQPARDRLAYVLLSPSQVRMPAGPAITPPGTNPASSETRFLTVLDARTGDLISLTAAQDD
jgi:hypothetical protein